MGVLRTAELLAAHEIDGAEQFFTRAIDYGYSFDPNEVIKFWGREEIIGDYVRHFRTLRPDIVVTMNIQGSGGDRAHEAQTILVREAFAIAGDPTKYPEQLKEGLQPWKPYKLYFSGVGIGGPGRGRGGVAGPGAAEAAAPPPVGPDGKAPHIDRIDMSVYDPLLGRTYQEIATDAHSNHKSQGANSLPQPPGIVNGGRAAGAPGGRGGGPGGGAGAAIPGNPYTLVDTRIPDAFSRPEGALFDGVDITLVGLAKYAGANPPAPLTSGLAAISGQALRAKQAFDAGNDAGTIAPIEAGLTAVRALRSRLGSMGLSDAARYEIDFRLKIKEEDYERAALAAHGLSFYAVANDGLIVAGQPINLSFSAVNRAAPEVTITDVAILGFEAAAPCAAATLKKDTVFSCSSAATAPKNATITEPYFKDKYWSKPSNPARYDFDPAVPFGTPFAPTPFHAVFKVKMGDVEVARDIPIEFRYVKDLYFGDKQMELNVVPAFSVRVTPTLAIVPASPAGAAATAKPVPREVFVAVTNGTKAPPRRPWRSMRPPAGSSRPRAQP